MKSLMDGIVKALKRKNQEASEFNGIYKEYSLSAGESDNYCSSDDFYSR